MTAALTAEELAAMEARSAQYTVRGAETLAHGFDGDPRADRHVRDRLLSAAEQSAADVPRLLTDHGRQREEIARLTAALDGARREERERTLAAIARVREGWPPVEGSRDAPGMSAARSAAHMALSEVVAAIRALPDAAPRAPRRTPPSRDEVRLHHAEHGGHWFVTRVNNGRIAHGCAGRDDWRPMVLRCIDSGFGPTATIPGISYGGAWDGEPWALMAGAEWVPVDRDGRLMAGEGSDGR